MNLFEGRINRLRLSLLMNSRDGCRASVEVIAAPTVPFHGVAGGHSAWIAQNVSGVIVPKVVGVVERAAIVVIWVIPADVGVSSLINAIMNLAESP